MEVVQVKIQKKSHVITQSNELTEARYFLTVGEQKIILLLISMINPEDTDFKSYEMKVTDFAKIMEINGKSLYERLNIILDKLLSRVIHIPKSTGFLKIGWVSSAEYIEGTGVIQLGFDSKLKPYLLQLQKNFKSYNLRLIVQFKSAYSVRIYMLLKQYENIKTREFDVLELKEILGIKDDEYPRYADFKKRVLTQAKKEFETKNAETGGYISDITFDLETIRTGREITRLRFKIRKQSYQERLPIELPAMATRPLLDTPATQALEKYGIRGEVAQKYLEQQEEAEILRCITLLEQAKAGDKIKNSESGYLLKLLEARAGKETEAEREEKEKTARQAQKKAETEQKKELEAKRAKLERQFSVQEQTRFIQTATEQEKKRIFALVQKDNPLCKTIADLDKRSSWAFAINYIAGYEDRKKQYLQEHL